jgi:hypothetical protein
MTDGELNRLFLRSLLFNGLGQALVTASTGISKTSSTKVEISEYRTCAIRHPSATIWKIRKPYGHLAIIVLAYDILYGENDFGYTGFRTPDPSDTCLCFWNKITSFMIPYQQTLGKAGPRFGKLSMGLKSTGEVSALAMIRW